MTMLVAQRRTIEPPPLLVWSELREIERLQAARDELRRRIALAPPRSYRRVLLDAQLRAVTAHQLSLETRIVGGRA